jgi:hypothetical protein
LCVHLGKFQDTIAPMSDDPYRDPAAKPEQDPEYFVKMKEGDEERGPYTLEALRSSFKRQLLGPTAMIRTRESVEWIPLRELIEATVQPARPRNPDTAPGRHEPWRARQEAPNNNPMIGLAMVLGGLALTAVSFSAGGSRGILFFGLVIAGIVRMVRTQ